jgi:hypothetical protein
MPTRLVAHIARRMPLRDVCQYFLHFILNDTFLYQCKLCKGMIRIKVFLYGIYYALNALPFWLKPSSVRTKARKSLFMAHHGNQEFD